MNFPKIIRTFSVMKKLALFFILLSCLEKIDLSQAGNKKTTPQIFIYLFFKIIT